MDNTQDQRVQLAELDRFCREAFTAAGADQATADAATKAMMHATRLGVDSHGVRLLPHYLTALKGGRLNRTPDVKVVGGFGAVEIVDADHAQGAVGAYRGMERALDLAKRFGVGAVAVRNNSHFGAAGAYALQAAESGFIGFAFCNSDALVRLHDGAERFHGTNPIAIGVPVADGDPWLLDMATSSIPYNRVLLYRSLGVTLPERVASDISGQDTRDAEAAEMLAPLGGEFGFKGAALAGVAEILSAVVTGMQLSFDIPSMEGPDFTQPRKLGAFMLALNPDAFLDREAFDAGMRRYLDQLRGSAAASGGRVMAPGDREWAVARQREAEGVTLDPATAEAFEEIAGEFGLAKPSA